MDIRIVAALLVAVLVLGWAAFTYNRLLRRRNRVDASWADVDVELTRRLELVPNLVAAARGYMQQESAVLQEATRARAAAAGAHTPAERGAAERGVRAVLGTVIATVEAYPDLRAGETVAELMRRLQATEERIAYARGYYNALVAEYEALRTTLPSNLVARALRFRPREFFDREGAEGVVVDLREPAGGAGGANAAG